MKPRHNDQEAPYQIEITYRKYDGAKLLWRRERGEWDWNPWILIKVDGKGPIV
jgi:hypothetical protein